LIGSIRKGSGHRGVLNYICRAGEPERKDARIIGGNMAGQTPRELAAEFGLVRKLRPKLARAVFHASLSNPATDRALSDDEWNAIAERYLHGMGFTAAPFVVVRHEDTSHAHIHVLASRINTAGNTVSEGHDFRRSETLLREIEKDYGLTQVASSPASLSQQQKQRRQHMDEQYRKAAEERLEESSKEAKRKHEQVFEATQMVAGCGEALTERELREIRRDMETKEYEERMRALFGEELSYVDRPNRNYKRLRLVFFKPIGYVTDQGNRLTAHNMSVDESGRRIVAIAASRGWKNINLWGPEDFVQSAMRHAISSGLIVNPTSPAQKRMLDAILSESGGDGGEILVPEPTTGAAPAEEACADITVPDLIVPPPVPLPPPSPFGEEIARKLAARRRKEEEQHRKFGTKRGGGIAP